MTGGGAGMGARWTGGGLEQAPKEITPAVSKINALRLKTPREEITDFIVSPWHVVIESAGCGERRISESMGNPAQPETVVNRPRAAALHCVTVQILLCWKWLRFSGPPIERRLDGAETRRKGAEVV